MLPHTRITQLSACFRIHAQDDVRRIYSLQKRDKIKCELTPARLQTCITRWDDCCFVSLQRFVGSIPRFPCAWCLRRNNRYYSLPNWRALEEDFSNPTSSLHQLQLPDWLVRNRRMIDRFFVVEEASKNNRLRLRSGCFRIRAQYDTSLYEWNQPN